MVERFLYDSVKIYHKESKVITGNQILHLYFQRD